MVSYSDYIGIAHDVYQQMGGTYDEDTAADLVETVAPYWNMNRDRLEDASRSQVEQELRQRLNV